MTQDQSHKAVLYAVLLLISGAYIYLSFTAPQQATAPGFELYEPWKTVIRITIMLPILLSWAFGAFAVHYLMSSAWHVKSVELGKMFRLLGYGVMALVVGSWVPSIIGQIRTNFFPDDAFLEMAATIAQNYAYVLFPLIGFALIYKASISPAAQAVPRNQSLPAAMLLIGILGALWIATIFTNQTRQTTTLEFGRPSYYINDALIILTLVTPTLAAWLMGIAGALNFSDLESGGSPSNRKAFTRIVHGLLIAVFNSMIINGLLSAGSERLTGVGLLFLLIIVYIFVFLAITSYGLIWRGAKDLSAYYEHQE